ncbi:MAG: SAM-dependent methyltransferase, partial [Candidatus Aerophobetes bacterium]|nr:SAM-dependent methyltransferase [Candidatus Aerophobetes bacterium]
LKTLGRKRIPFLEWGYIILIATLFQAVIASIVLIILPLFFLPRERSSKKFFSWNKMRVFLYFLSLGFAYMFLEISFIQRFTLFLYYPIYTVAVVITGFLTFSGLGSGFSSRFISRRRYGITLSLIGIAGLSSIYIIYLRSLFLSMIALPDWLKISISLGLIAPLAFFMGMPFPLGLSRVSRRKSSLVPWAWGINGCASVISTILASVFAISGSFTFVGFSAIFLYILAYLTYPS